MGWLVELGGFFLEMAPVAKRPRGQPRTGPLCLAARQELRIMPALSRCAACRKHEEEHKPEAHLFERDNSLPRWHGWHAFRRGLATNLRHALGVEDKTIQAILRHSNVGLTMNVYVKSVGESQVSAMDTLSEKLGVCNDYATSKRIQQAKSGRINATPR
jgi:integrase